MAEWTKVESNEVTEAYIPEIGERIGTLNGVETATADTVILRKRRGEGEWFTLITDKDTFLSLYEVPDEFDESEGVKENPTESSESMENGVDSGVQSDEPTKDYWGYDVPSLREQCKERELDTSGNKPDLVERLEKDDDARTKQE